MGTFVGDVDAYCSKHRDQIKRGKTVRMLASTVDGRSIELTSQPLPDGGWLATFEDITERERANDRILHLAHYDGLTGLPNRIKFREKLEQILTERAEGLRLAVLYLDLDNFKGVNDTLGHPAGDELLKVVAARLSSCLGEADFVARLGGDEFAVIMAEAEDDAAIADLVQRIGAAISVPLQLDGHQIVSEASIGIALAPTHGTEPDQLLKCADVALYDVKAKGRGAFRVFEPAMYERVKLRRSLEQDLRQAVERGELELHYQPLVSLRTNMISGCEALVRWHHPMHGLIPPMKFIPIAEESGLIAQIGEWALKTACAEAASWRQPIRLAVNVSPVQFRNEQLALTVISALARSGLPPERLELEVTEDVLIRDDEAALSILHQLQGLGVRIALDDFGTGYSSLSYLQRFAFNKIKIDQCFIKDIAEPNGSLPIVQAIVSIAAARNMTTTAEGVETAEQLSTLRACGCTEMQGFLFCVPKTAVEVRKLFAIAAPARIAAA
jgi:diguanylate cyclase (GGDEF)-like protein